MSTKRFTEQNRRAWNEIAVARQGKATPAAFFRDGKVTLDDDALLALGDVRGKRVLNLQCANGEDTLSFAVMGADAVGVDISDASIALAEALARESGVNAAFVCADVYELPTALQRADFDVVWSSAGITCWLPDLAAWATAIALALRAGGRLVLEDHHPLVEVLSFHDGEVEVSRDYFGRSEPVSATDLGKIGCGVESEETHHLFLWPLGDITTAIARAGFRIESLEEFPLQEVPYSRADRPDVEVPSAVLQLPGSYRLVAVREEGDA